MKRIMYVVLPALVLVSIAMLGVVEAKVFTGHSYGFTYPNGCKPDKDTNKYSNSITLECKEDMMIQLNSGGISGDDVSTSTDDTVADDMFSLFDSGWDDVNEVERGNITIGNTSAPFVVATYKQTYNNLFGFQNDRTEEFVVMLIAIKSGDGYIVGQYKNSAGDFDKGRTIAEKIFSSVAPKQNVGIGQDEGEGNSSGESSYEKCQNKSQDQYENLKDKCGDKA